jgi:thioredoxin-related protein
MVLPNGSNFTSASIKKGKPIILIYFSPDCDHCKVLMNEFFKRTSDFDKAEIVMVTFKPLKEVVQFISDYRVNQHPNIIVGSETPMFYIRYYYNLTSTPYTALFDKKGQLVYSYRKETSLSDLANRLKNIK